MSTEPYKLDVKKDPSKFMRYDAGKLRYDIYPNSVLEDVIKVLMFGATKYEMDNWKKATDTKTFYNSARRHEEAWKAGEYYDAESGLPHLAHVLCNWTFAHYIEEQERKKANNGSNASNT